MDITPHVEYLRALRHQKIRWAVLLGELLDNSLDAAAARVEVQLGPNRQISIRDDGVGCKDVSAMLTLGGRHSHATTKLGRYGIGLKDAALYLWGTTTIETSCKGETRKVCVDWSKVEGRDGRWVAPDAIVSGASDRSGTNITFSKIEKNLPAADALIDELGWMFAPALLSGKQIVIRGKHSSVCKPYCLPPLVDVVESQFDVQGRGVRLRCGIVADGHANKRPGFTFQHGHRSIMTSALGAGSLSTSRIAGIVELDEKWSLAKNKDDITEFNDELGAAIFERCESMLRKADLQASTLESSLLSDQVSEQLTAALRGVAALRRERRDKPQESQAGTVIPVGTERTRRRAAKVHDADGQIERAARTGVRLEWASLPTSTVGRADLHGNRVTLNSDMALLQRLRATENVDAIAIVAFGVYVNEINDPQQGNTQKRLPFDPNGFLDDWGRVLAGMPAVETKTKGRASA